MINSNNDAIGVIFSNSYDAFVPELVSERLMASIPFASRYRIIDFMLSSMVNSGIDNVSIVVRKNYHSLMDHLGSGREWDLTRKNGGLNIVPPFAQKAINVYHGRVEAMASIMGFLKAQKEKYVIMTDSNIAVNFDFNEMIKAHEESKADVTIAYTKGPIPKSLLELKVSSKDLYYTFDLEGTRVKAVEINSKEDGEKNLSMNIYLLERELLIDLITDAFAKGYHFFERDVIMPRLSELNVQGYLFEGYAARILSTASYFEENMKMLDEKNLEALFSPSPIYTKIRDDNPTRYMNGAKVSNTMAADGCVIEGEVENSILFRGVKIGKGAKVRNCVLMQDTVVEDGARIEYIITDKNVKISAGKEMKGTDIYQVYVAKHEVV